MLIRQSAVYALGAIALAVIALALIAVYSRLFTAEQYGAYAIVMSSAALAYGATVNWLSMTIIRMYAASPDRQSFLGAILYYYLLVAGIGTVGALLACLWLKDAEDRTLVLVGLTVYLSIGWMELQFRIYQARLEAGRLTRARLVRTGLAAAVGVSLAWAGWGPIGALIGVLAGAILPALVEIIKVWRHVPVGGTAAMRRELWLYGSPLIPSFAIGQISQVSGRYLLIWLEGMAAVGIYSLAHELARRLANTLMMPMTSAATPLAVKDVEGNDPTAARRGLHNAFVLFVGVALPSMAGIALVVNDLAFVFVGPDFRSGVVLMLPLLALSVFVIELTNAYLDLSLHLSRKSKRILYRSIVSAFLNVALGYLFISNYGLIGAAYAALMSAVLTGVFTWWLGRDGFDLPFPVPPLVKVTVATGVMAVSVLLVPLEPGIFALTTKVLLGVGVYALSLFVLDIEGIRRQFPDHMQRLRKNFSLRRSTRA